MVDLSDYYWELDRDIVRKEDVIIANPRKAGEPRFLIVIPDCLNRLQTTDAASREQQHAFAVEVLHLLSGVKG